MKFSVDRIRRLVIGSLKRTLTQIAATSREEKVGMLLGEVLEDSAIVRLMYWVKNVKSSPVEFEADPWQVVQAHEVASKHGLEVIAVFHTHPSCPAVPSQLDLRGMRLWPVLWVIACKDEVRAWILSDGLREVEIE